MKNINKILFAISFLFGGVIIGFLLAPIKKGMTMSIGNNNGNQYVKKDEDLDCLKS